MKKTIYGMGGMAVLAGAGLLSGGCKTDLQQAQQIADKPIYRVFERVNKAEKSNSAECLRLFDQKKDKTNLSSMAQVNLNPGVAVEARILTTAEIYYVVSGAGMVEVNGAAYVLRENSGIYIPAGSKLSMLNNGSQPFKCLVIAKTLPWIDGKTMPRTMVFDKNAAKEGESRTYEEIVGSSNQPQSLAPETLKTTRLTPSEAKVKTLNQDMNQ